MDPFDAVSSLRACLRELRAAGLVDSYERVDLAAWTSLRVGGISDLLIRCRTVEGVRATLDLMAVHGLRWVTMGSGSRLVPPDRPLRVPVVTIGGALADWELVGDAVEAGGGAGLPQLQRSMVGAGVRASARLFGTNGTAGGAIDDALSIPGCDLAEDEWVEVVGPGREPVRHRHFGEHGLASLHRCVVTRVRLKVSAGLECRPRPVVPAAAARTVSPLFHPVPGESVDSVLVETGCAELFVGGARIDPSQPNSLRTARSATARDVRALCREVIHRVRLSSGHELRSRLRFIDEWGREVE